MIEKWTEFQGGPNRSGRDEARVTLNNRGVLNLNKTAYEALGMPAAVKLSYEEDRRVIGLKPHDPRHSNAFPVKLKDKWHNRTVHLSPFCRHWGIDIRRTVLFNEIDIDREGMMRLELNRTQTIGKAERNGKR
jgi:hypothetical protein